MPLRKTILTAMAIGLVAVTAPGAGAPCRDQRHRGLDVQRRRQVGAIGRFPHRVAPRMAFSWGARLGFNLNENTEVGSSSQADTDPRGVGSRQPQRAADDLQLPGYFAYNFGDSDATVRRTSWAVSAPRSTGGLSTTGRRHRR